MPDPEVVEEQVLEDAVVVEVEVEEPPVEQPKEQPSAEPRVDDRVLSPSEVLERVTLERVKRPVAAPDAPPQEEDLEPQRTAVPPPSDARASVDAQRSDNIIPVYPRRELRQGREGSVVVHVVIAADGSVTRASLSKRSRFEGFNESALAAARRWTFVPATASGVAVASEQEIEIVFRLKGEG